jgi:hypothetical protein
MCHSSEVKNRVRNELFSKLAQKVKEWNLFINRICNNRFKYIHLMRLYIEYINKDFHKKCIKYCMHSISMYLQNNA